MEWVVGLDGGPRLEGKDRTNAREFCMELGELQRRWIQL